MIAIHLVDEHWYTQNSVIRLMLLAKSLSVEEVAHQIIMAYLLS